MGLGALALAGWLLHLPLAVTGLILIAGLIIACFTGITVYFRARMRERTEELRVSNENFRVLVSGVTDYAILMLGPDGRVATWNAGAERIKGYTAAEVVGKHFSCFYTPEDIERGHPQEELRIALAEGQFEDEGWRVKRDGSRFWASVLITAVRDVHGELLGFRRSPATSRRGRYSNSNSVKKTKCSSSRSEKHRRPSGPRVSFWR